MSRTDAHAPYWTWATWYEPAHSIYCPHYLNRSWQKTLKRDCNLPAEPHRHDSQFVYRRAGHVCSWEPVWPPFRQVRWMRYRHVPKWFVDHRWNNPERVRSRDELGKLVKEYNANGDIYDGDFACYRGRHGARWAWD